MPVQPDMGPLTAVQLGKNISLFRRRRGMSQKDLAARVNICIPPMNKIEKGRNYPSSPIIFRIAKVLGVAVEDLFAEDTAQYVNRLSATPPASAACAEASPEYVTGDTEKDWHLRRMRVLRADVVRLGPSEAVHATVRQLGIGPNGWTWDLLLRIKHRFGVSAEAFLYRLGELDLIAKEPAESFKARITEHYKATDYGEPDGTRRILTPNGRLGDLLLLAMPMKEHAVEVKAIQKLFKHNGIET